MEIDGCYDRTPIQRKVGADWQLFAAGVLEYASKFMNLSLILQETSVIMIRCVQTHI